MKFPSSVRVRSSAVAVALTTLALAGCGALGAKEQDPEKNESWPDGSCVVIDGEVDVDPADCNGPHDGKVIGNIPPMTLDGECPSGTDKRVREDRVTGDGALIQEYVLCLQEPRPTTRRNLEVVADPAAVKVFTDPATEIEDAGDLTEYLLPGLDGPGVDCARRWFGRDDVRGKAPAEGARLAGEIVGLCFEAPGIGRLLTMYNYVVRDADDVRLYQQYIDCIEPAVAAQPAARQHEAVTKVFEARLDLQGPVGSPKVASEQITALAPDC